MYQFAGDALGFQGCLIGSNLNVAIPLFSSAVKKNKKRRRTEEICLEIENQRS